MTRMTTTTATPTHSHDQYAGDYLLCGRLHSFAHQIETVLVYKPQRVLEIGVGPGLVTASLLQLGIDVTTLDIDASLMPDLCASVTDIPIPNDAVDVSVCCQVLEHMPFDDACSALCEIRRVTGTALVLSVPDITRYMDIALTTPKLGSQHLKLDLPRLLPRSIDPQRACNGGHCWEIGYRDHSLRTVRSAIEQTGWNIVRTWRVPELLWHRFFQLEPRA